MDDCIERYLLSVPNIIDIKVRFLSNNFHVEIACYFDSSLQRVNYSGTGHSLSDLVKKLCDRIAVDNERNSHD